METTEKIFLTENNSTFLTSFTFVSGTLGLALSAGALSLLILTAVLFQEWRENYKNQLLIQFMFARFMYTLRAYQANMIYITNEYISALVKACILIYTELVLVLWMFILSKQMYDSFVKVFKGTQPNIYAVAVFSWFMPAVVTLLIYVYFWFRGALDYMNFLCCLFLFKWPVLCANALMLILILKSILNINLSKTEKNFRIVVVIIILICSFCIQQAAVDIFRLIYKIDYTDNTIILLNILSMYHCATSILFWLFGNSKTRALWTFNKK